jgi:hypothetical protein
LVEAKLDARKWDKKRDYWEGGGMLSIPRTAVGREEKMSVLAVFLASFSESLICH